MKNCPTCRSTYPTDFAVCPRDGTALIEAGAWREGTIIREKYRIICQIGEGGMGTVYKALHVHFDEVRALKVIRQEYVQEENFLRRFMREAVIMRRLQHPNAVRVDDIERAEDGRPFIVMEYVEGRNLRDVIDQEAPMEVERVCRVIKQVAAALEAAHELGMVHRDIKPANIVLVGSPEGEQVKVLDFGIAKVKEQHLEDTNQRRMTLTGTGMLIGTPAYMSPEQAEGKKGDDLDGRSDLYSLGVVMYQMLAGDLPLKADSGLHLLWAHIHTPPRALRAYRPDVPEPIQSLVMSCLEKRREQRPADAKRLIQAIEYWEQEGLRKQEAVRAEEDRLLRERAEEDRLTKEKLEQERWAREEKLAERLKLMQAEVERLAQDKRQAEREAIEAAERERIAAVRAEQERLAREKTDRNLKAWEVAEAERRVKVQAEADRLKLEKAQAEQRASEAVERERKAREFAGQERLAREKLEKERKQTALAEAKRSAEIRAEAERLATEKKEAEKRASEAAERERKAHEIAKQERLAREKTDKSRKAWEVAEAERRAKVQAEADRLKLEKAQAEQRASEAAEREGLARRQAEQERLARQKVEKEREQAALAEAKRSAEVRAEAERLAAEKKEAEKRAAEAAERESLARQQAERERLGSARLEQELLANRDTAGKRHGHELPQTEPRRQPAADDSTITAEVSSRGRSQPAPSFEDFLSPHGGITEEIAVGPGSQPADSLATKVAAERGLPSWDQSEQSKMGRSISARCPDQQPEIALPASSTESAIRGPLVGTGAAVSPGQIASRPLHPRGMGRRLQRAGLAAVASVVFLGVAGHYWRLRRTANLKSSDVPHRVAIPAGTPLALPHKAQNAQPVDIQLPKTERRPEIRGTPGASKRERFAKRATGRHVPLSQETIDRPKRVTSRTATAIKQGNTPNEHVTVLNAVDHAAIAIGDTDYQNGNYDAAIKEYQKALQLNPADSAEIAARIDRAQKGKAAEAAVGTLSH